MKFLVVVIALTKGLHLHLETGGEGMCSYHTCLTNSILFSDIESITTQTVTTGDHYTCPKA